MNLEKARFNMIEQQVKPWKVFDENLLGAMATVPREKFIPESHRNLAYADITIPLGHNQHMLAPRELARMIQALELKGEEKVLEIGCGSGYSSALLAKLAKKVYSVDIIGDFVDDARKKLNQLSFTNVELEETDASECWLSKAPYDAVIVTSALPSISQSYQKALADGGRIAAITGSDGHFVAKICQFDAQGNWVEEELFPINAVPMINAEQPNRFEF